LIQIIPNDDPSREDAFSSSREVGSKGLQLEKKEQDAATLFNQSQDAGRFNAGF